MPGNVLLTGASRGLGAVIARTLVQHGFSIWCVSRVEGPDLADLRRNHPDRVHFRSYDLSEVADMQKALFQEFLTLDIPLAAYVNNAAVAYDDLVTNLDFDRLQAMFNVNVFAPMMIVKYAIRNMLYHNTPGSILHNSSISVHTGYKGLAMYASTKGALEAFSKNTAREWGERKIRSNCIVCGFMETDMSAILRADQKERIYKRTCLKEATKLESVSSTVSFLISKAAASITGQNIFVDSGTI